MKIRQFVVAVWMLSGIDDIPTPVHVPSADGYRRHPVFACQ